MLKRGFLVFTVLLVSLSFAYANPGFSLSYESIKDNVVVNEAAEFYLTINNNESFDDSYKISFGINPQWSIQILPPKDSIVTITSGATRKIKISLMAVSNMPPSLYRIPVKVKSTKTEVLEEINLPIYLNSGENAGSYPPTVTADVEIPESIKPGENFQIKVNLKNRNPLNISKLDIRLSSIVINKETTTSLEPLEEKTVVITYSVDSLQPPMDDTVNLEIYAGGEKIRSIEDIPVKVISYSEIEYSSFEEKSFLKTEQKITYTNNGNVKKQETLKIEIGFFKDLVTSTDPKMYVIKENGKRYRALDVDLKPAGKIEVIVITNFRPLVIIIVLTLIILILYYILRGDIIVKKQAVVLGTKEGGITEIKVIMNVRNRTGRQIKNVSIIDGVPNIADIEKDFQIGTLKPTKIVMHDKKGNIVKWNVDILDRFEERLITYKIKSRLSILGTFSLRPAIVKYENKSGKISITRSNRVELAYEKKSKAI
ncbi:MAG: hypothetical protein PHV16_04230 [Candidatus Nanoarchaeia archaeon]|nr:hypothetical protein [Candidatus Nanoarchaeia archaeon]